MRKWTTAAAVLGFAAPAWATVEVVPVDEAGPWTDPKAEIWNQVEETPVSLTAQTITAPQLQGEGVTEVRVRAVHDGEWIGFHLSWDDEAPNDDLRTARFGDQVAVQLPLEPHGETPPNPMMGHDGAPVYILQWRAAVQRDVTEGRPEISDLYPNMWVDVYPDEIMSEDDAAPYSGARAVGNPMAVDAEQPVLAHVAEGWGSLTATEAQLGRGGGTWEDGSWHVVISHPLALDDEETRQLLPGSSTTAAFAVWDGADGQVGGRKTWSVWVPIEIGAQP